MLRERVGQRAHGRVFLRPRFTGLRARVGGARVAVLPSAQADLGLQGVEIITEPRTCPLRRRGLVTGRGRLWIGVPVGTGGLPWLQILPVCSL